MPQYTEADRQMIMSEAMLWAAYDVVVEASGNCGKWNDDVDLVKVSIRTLAEKMREYNDQFEVSDE